MEFLLIASTHFLALLSPGPDFFLIMQASLRLPLRYGLAVCCGIALANGAYLFIAVLGLEFVKDLDWLTTTLRYLVSVYLIFVGLMLLRAPRSSLDIGTGSVLHTQHIGRQFLIGFMSGILNPKNAVFYLSLFTVMVSEQTGLAVRCLYALWMTAVVLLWDSFLVFAAGRRQVKDYLGRSVFYVEKIAGSMLTLFGVLLPFT